MKWSKTKAWVNGMQKSSRQISAPHWISATCQITGSKNSTILHCLSYLFSFSNIFHLSKKWTSQTICCFSQLCWISPLILLQKRREKPVAVAEGCCHNFFGRPQEAVLSFFASQFLETIQNNLEKQHISFDFYWKIETNDRRINFTGLCKDWH